MINLQAFLFDIPVRPTKLNEANAVSFVAVKHVLENVDSFWQVK